ncbi:hypothetical protein KQ929_12140 [Leclercia pneumoniae]|uniref:Uncharacterized protein n=1 Tax=Leclercia pneumoniae TaxID=2815358 RepID=A0ABX8JNZ0_9ENTR|nr:hypothetical protein [Leclercia pneumoniae]QWW78027.1 hypothetical protein KQ929_12140 [Leclercia pneumoniae]
MIQQQLIQIVFWLGVIVSLPTFYRFVYAGSALIWRQLFPTRKVEIRMHDSEHRLIKTLTIKLDGSEGKKVVDLIEEAKSKVSAKQ